MRAWDNQQRHYATREDKTVFSGGTLIKNLPANAQDVGSIRGLERCPGEGNDSPLQYSCQGNSMDRGAWWAKAHGFSKDLDTT